MHGFSPPSSMVPLPQPLRPPPGSQRPSACRVPGCQQPLVNTYNQRNRVCAFHYRADAFPMEGDGAPWRFCQQCAKPQPLAMFDEGRRSCRDSLVRHKKRRRDPGGRAARAAANSDGSSDDSSSRSPASRRQRLAAADAPSQGNSAAFGQGAASLPCNQLPQALAQQALPPQALLPGHSLEPTLTAAWSLPLQRAGSGPAAAEAIHAAMAAAAAAQEKASSPGAATSRPSPAQRADSGTLQRWDSVWMMVELMRTEAQLAAAQQGLHPLCSQQLQLLAPPPLQALMPQAAAAPSPVQPAGADPGKQQLAALLLQLVQQQQEEQQQLAAAVQRQEAAQAAGLVLECLQLEAALQQKAQQLERRLAPPVHKNTAAMHGLHAALASPPNAPELGSSLPAGAACKPAVHASQAALSQLWPVQQQAQARAAAAAAAAQQQQQQQQQHALMQLLGSLVEAAQGPKPRPSPTGTPAGAAAGARSLPSCSGAAPTAALAQEELALAQLLLGLAG